MMVFIKENWFKVCILLVILITATGYISYLKDRNRMEKQKINQLRIDKLNEQVLADAESIKINSCITDAYSSLKVLQNNYHVTYLHFLKESSPLASRWDYKKLQQEAFDTYQNEWVPQCKLGNRVFLDYEPYDFEQI